MKTDLLPYSAGIIVISDRCYRGEMKDRGGPAIEEFLIANKFQVHPPVIIPDEMEEIVESLVRLTDVEKLSMVITTGGTGFANRDVTPEATEQVIERRARGLEIALISQLISQTPRAMLSRLVVGIRRRTLIINLPGNPKAISEYLNILQPVLRHGIDLLQRPVSDEEHDLL